MIVFRVLAVLAIIILVSNCTTSNERLAIQYSPCETLQLLIEQHAKGFESLKSSPKNSKKLTVWKTKYQAIGEHCQVWEWGDGSATYTCNEVFPSKDLAMEKYKDQKLVVQSCLGDKWQPMEAPRKLGVGERTVYSTPNNNTHVALHVIETKDLVKSVWTVYYFVGDFEKDL